MSRTYSSAVENANNNFQSMLRFLASHDLAEKANERADRYADSNISISDYALARRKREDEAMDSAAAAAARYLNEGGKTMDIGDSIVDALARFGDGDSLMNGLRAVLGIAPERRERAKEQRQENYGNALGEAIMAFLDSHEGNDSPQMQAVRAAAEKDPLAAVAAMQLFGKQDKTPRVGSIRTSDGRTVDILYDSTGNTKFIPSENKSGGDKLPSQIYQDGEVIPMFIETPAYAEIDGNRIPMGTEKRINPAYEEAVAKKRGDKPKSRREAEEQKQRDDKAVDDALSLFF